MENKNIQHFEWGQIEWIYESEAYNSFNNMSIAITTIFPHKRQTRHIHYGDEQVIYVLSGEGTQLVGDKKGDIKPEVIYHIEAGSIHETINESDEPIKELIISIPVQYEHNLLIQKRKENILDKLYNSEETVKISNEIRHIYEAIVNPMRIPVSIYNIDGNVVIQGKEYPEFCKSKCLYENDNVKCPIYEKKGEYGPPHYTDLSAYVCPHGLTVFVIPIMFNNKPIGTIRAGHIRTSTSSLIDLYNSNEETNKEFDELMPVVPKGTLNAVLQQLKKLSKTIENYYIFKTTEVELSKKEEIIQDIVKNEIALEETLRSTREKVLNTQINNHFLFNTLNVIAGMAIKENSIKTYQSIIDLSKMLRYTSTCQSYFSKVKNEIQYLQNYINLQKLRYGDKVRIKINITRDIEEANIPFNCLQPIVENCFVHGFKDMKDNMAINISGHIFEDRIIIEIGDNGHGLNKVNINKLKQRISEYEKYELRGLMMVYVKLKLLYGEKFNFDIESSESKGTLIKLVFPKYMA